MPDDFIPAQTPAAASAAVPDFIPAATAAGGAAPGAPPPPGAANAGAPPALDANGELDTDPFKIPVAQRGGAQGVGRTVTQFAGLPKNLYHVVFDDPRDDDERTKAEATAASMKAIHGVAIPERVALILNRMIIDPMVEQSDKADTYARIAESRHTNHPADWEGETGIRKAIDWTVGDFSSDDATNDAHHRANMHRLASMIPLLGPVAGEFAERYSQGDRSGAVAELLSNIVGAKVIEAAGGAGVRAVSRRAGAAADVVAPTTRAIAGQEVPVLASQTGSTAGRVAQGAAKLTGVSGEHLLKKFVRSQDEAGQAAMGNMARESAGRTAENLEASGATGLEMEPEQLAAMTDAHEALRESSSFGEAAERMQGAAAEHFKILDNATNGELGALKAERNALFRALRNPANEAGKITEQLGKIAEKENQVFDGVGIGEDTGRSVLDTARQAWKKSLALQELDARVARASTESFSPKGIDSPLQTSTRGSTLLKQLRSMGDDRLNLALGDPQHVADLKRIGALLQDGQNVTRLSLSMRLLRGSRILGAFHHPVAVAATEGISYMLGKMLTSKSTASYLANALSKAETAPMIAGNIAKLWAAKPAPEDADTGQE